MWSAPLFGHPERQGHGPDLGMEAENCSLALHYCTISSTLHNGIAALIEASIEASVQIHVPVYGGKAPAMRRRGPLWQRCGAGGERCA